MRIGSELICLQHVGDVTSAEAACSQNAATIYRSRRVVLHGVPPFLVLPPAVTCPILHMWFEV